jgi:hypothetical protein
MSDLVPGIDVPDRTIASIRTDTDREAARLAEGTRIMIFGCMNAGVAEAFRYLLRPAAALLRRLCH